MTTQDATSRRRSIGETLIDGLTIKAPSMIVTIYGDIVVPRGGILWMGTLIETCAGFGISETQVRTAVSRLVTAGRLTGIRDGRRSYYRLADSALEEFDMAARLLFEPIPPADGWLVCRPAALGDDEIRRSRLAALAGNVYIRPNHAHLPPLPALTFRSTLTEGREEMAALAASLWPLEAYAEEYRRFLARFRPLLDHGPAGAGLSRQDCVFARLLLVHTYRHILLADPLLPAEVLPPDWPGLEARTLFARLYIALSAKADAQIAMQFEGRDTFLPEATAQTENRLRSLGHTQFFC